MREANPLSASPSDTGARPQRMGEKGRVSGHSPSLPAGTDSREVSPAMKPESTSPYIHAQKVAQNASTNTWQGRRGAKGRSPAGSACRVSMCTDTTAHTTPKANTQHAAEANMAEAQSRPAHAGVLPLKTPSNKCPGI